RILRGQSSSRARRFPLSAFSVCGCQPFADLHVSSSVPHADGHMPLTRISLRRRLPLLIGALLLAVTAVLSWVAYWGFRNALLAAAQTRLSSAADLLAGLIETSAQQLITTARAGAARPSTVAYFHHPDARTGTAALAALAVKDNPNATTPAPDVELLDPRGERLLSSAANPRGYGKIDPGALRAAAGPDSGVVGRFHAARDSAWYPTVAPVFFQARLAGYVVFWRRLSGTAKAKTQLNQLIGQGGTATIYFGNTAGDVWTDQTAIVPG